MTPARSVCFTVIGLPATKGSSGSFISKTTGKPFHKPDNPRTKGWQQLIGETAVGALQRADVQPFVEGPVALEVAFFLPRPKKYLTRKYAPVAVPHVTKPDADKLLRACKDALSKVVWRDDAQVTDVVVRKRYCAEGEFPRATITVTELVPAIPALMPGPRAPLFS